MTTQDAPSTTPRIEPGRLAMFADRVAEHDAERPGYAHLWERLSQAILVHGGEAVVPPLDPLERSFAEMLIADGEPQGPRARKAGGDRSDCHRNTARLLRAGKAAGIGTGYALSDDGLWRQHTWGLGSDGVVLETTVRREQYWGLQFRGEQATYFADNVLDPL
jgi:hypothetical protein